MTKLCAQHNDKSDETKNMTAIQKASLHFTMEKEKERKTEYNFIAQEQRSLLTWVISTSGSSTSVSSIVNLIFPIELTSCIKGR